MMLRQKDFISFSPLFYGISDDTFMYQEKGKVIIDTFSPLFYGISDDTHNYSIFRTSCFNLSVPYFTGLVMILEIACEWAGMEIVFQSPILRD